MRSVFGRGERVAVLVEVAEEREAAVLEASSSRPRSRGEAGDEVVDELRDRRCSADDDEAGRHADARLLPELEGLLVVAVERLERGLELRRQAERVELAALPRPFFGIFLPDVLPEVAEHRHLVAGDVVGDRDARQLHDAALDRVHEREVAHRPREERALGVARAAEEERRGREVDDAREAELAVHRLEAGDPEAGGLVVLLGLLPLVALEVLVVLVGRLLAVAVVRLVVEDEDVLHAHQVGHDALEHLAFGLERVELLAAALEQRAAALRELDPLAELEGVVVGDDDLRALDVVEHVGRDQLAACVVAVGVVRLEDAQAVLDREPGRDDEEAAREALALRAADGVDRLPGDEHRHDGRLAGAGGELQREAQQLRVGVVVRVREVLEEPLAALAGVRRDLGQPDGRLDRLDLAEERADALNWWCRQCWRSRAVSGVTCQWFGFGRLRHCVDERAELVDDRGRVVLLRLRRDARRPRRRRAPAGRLPRLRFFGLGIGVMNSARRRLSMICCVGWPCSSSSQCRAGTRRAS